MPLHVRSRLFIHAGFAKCGSASIRTALFQNFRKLQQDNVLVFDKDLKIARRAADLIGTPIWSLEQARKQSENLTRRLSAEIAPVLKRKGDHLAILSAENLANPGMADLFAGLDGRCDVSVIFYIRPQLQWIPSAWKQWGLKTGTSLSDFVAQCINTRTPTFRRDIESWKSTLPAANIRVQFLIPELLAGGNPAQDFFNLLNLSQQKYRFESEARNPSLDVSVLHVLSKNPHLFSDVHDNRLMLALTRALPKEYRSTNVDMLSAEQEAMIEESFRDENRWLLNTYCSKEDVDRIYLKHFTPREADARYSDLIESDLIYRCLGIILESIAFSSEQPERDKSKSQERNSALFEEE
ncbi:MAG TPA: hypothetical protein VHT01_09905 [Candidatus Udaeobacter sp.]|nr:hypothetical protein [Candidatus Udaeobacter sp.]